MRKTLGILVAALVLAAGLPAQARLQHRMVEYRQGDAVMEGYLVYDDARSGKRPGVLVVHEWMGIGPYAMKRADQLAQLGYVAFAADIYGKGVRPRNQQEAGAQSGKYRGNRPLLRQRVNAALDVLKQEPHTDTGRLAAIGYCFGGTTVLELARSGAEVAGVVSFHGGLGTPSPADARQIKGKVLVLHGADDPFVKAEEVQAFEDEMRKGGVDWQLVAYGGAVHSFTNPAAGNDNSKGAAYNERAERRSWEAMKAFFADIFR
jgi:dienelactone hydrolase